MMEETTIPHKEEEDKKPRKKTYKYKDIFEGEIPKHQQNKPIKTKTKKG